MEARSRFSEDVSEEELNALIQKALLEKTKIARKYGLKISKVRKKKESKVSVWQFHSTNSRWCIISIGCLNKFNNCLSIKVLLFCCFSFARVILSGDKNFELLLALTSFRNISLQSLEFEMERLGFYKVLLFLECTMTTNFKPKS